MERGEQRRKRSKEKEGGGGRGGAGDLKAKNTIESPAFSKQAFAQSHLPLARDLKSPGIIDSLCTHFFFPRHDFLLDYTGPQQKKGWKESECRVHLLPNISLS